MGVKEALAVLGRGWKVGSGDTGNESECMSGVGHGGQEPVASQFWFVLFYIMCLNEKANKNSLSFLE